MLEGVYKGRLEAPADELKCTIKGCLEVVSV